MPMLIYMRDGPDFAYQPIKETSEDALADMTPATLRGVLTYSTSMCASTESYRGRHNKGIQITGQDRTRQKR